MPTSVSRDREADIVDRRSIDSAANERTRLISADDEAVDVTPYNLAIVRNMRRVTVLLFVISAGWWVVNLVSIFVTFSSKVHARGSGFTQFTFSTIATFNLLFSLLFFETPSKADRILALSISVFLVVDLVVILATPKLRTDEHWIGIASALWAAIIGAWTVMTDRVVQYGKEEEEERLLGRVETRRTLNEWMKVFTTLVAFSLLAAVSFLTFATLIMRAHDSTLRAPGQKVWVHQNAYQVHVNCFGNASSLPTVLLEGGELPVEQFTTWALEAQSQYELGQVCYWDRPGYGWSDNAPSPASAGQIVDALSEAIIEAEVDGPFVLVSHGVGGIYSRIFAARHKSDVAGLMLVDTLHEDLLGTIGNFKNGFALVLRGIFTPLGIDRLSLWIFGGRSREDRTYGMTAWRGGKWTKARLQECIAAQTFTRNEVIAARAILGRDVPITVISSGKMIKRSPEWESKQRDLASMSDDSTWEVVNHADHNVWMIAEGAEVLRSQLAKLVKKT